MKCSVKNREGEDINSTPISLQFKARNVPFCAQSSFTCKAGWGRRCPSEHCIPNFFWWWRWLLLAIYRYPFTFFLKKGYKCSGHEVVTALPKHKGNKLTATVTQAETIRNKETHDGYILKRQQGGNKPIAGANESMLAMYHVNGKFSTNQNHGQNSITGDSFGRCD